MLTKIFGKKNNKKCELYKKLLVDENGKLYVGIESYLEYVKDIDFVRCFLREPEFSFIVKEIKQGNVFFSSLVDRTLKFPLEVKTFLKGVRHKCVFYKEENGVICVKIESEAGMLVDEIDRINLIRDCSRAIGGEILKIGFSLKEDLCV